MLTHISNFIKKVSFLVSGTVIGQLIPIIFLPVITRIYGPEEFAGLVIFISISSVFGVISNLRLQLAIVQPKEDREANILLICSITVGLLLSLLVGSCFYFLNWISDGLVGSYTTNFPIEVLPFTILALSIQQATTYWLLRNDKITFVAISKIIQGIVSVCGYILLGLIDASSKNLIFGYFLGISATALYLSVQGMTATKVYLYFPRYEISAVIRKFKLFPLLSTPGALLNSLSTQMPNYAFAKFQEVASTGAFGLVTRVLSAPSSFISASVSQVLLKKSADRDQENLKFHIFVSLIFLMLLICYSPLAFIISFAGVEIFVYVFGSEWSEAGRMSETLVWALFLRFAVSPMSIILSLNNYLVRGLSWQFSYLVSLCLVLYFYASQPPEMLIKALVINDLLMYSVYLVLIILTARNLNKESD